MSLEVTCFLLFCTNLWTNANLKVDVEKSTRAYTVYESGVMRLDLHPAEWW